MKDLLRNAMIYTAMGATMGFLFALIPEAFFCKISFLFASFSFEKNGSIYEKHFKVSKWKDKLPQFNKIVKVGFRKDTLNSLAPNYLSRFLTETMRAELCHIICTLISPVYFLFDTRGWAVTMLIFTIISNIPFIMIQRYNRPRINKLLHQIEKRNSRHST